MQQDRYKWQQYRRQFNNRRPDRERHDARQRGGFDRQRPNWRGGFDQHW